MKLPGLQTRGVLCIGCNLFFVAGRYSARMWADNGKHLKSECEIAAESPKERKEKIHTYDTLIGAKNFLGTIRTSQGNLGYPII